MQKLTRLLSGALSLTLLWGVAEHSSAQTHATPEHPGKPGHLYILGKDDNILSIVDDQDITTIRPGILIARRTQVHRHFVEMMGQRTFYVETDAVDCNANRITDVNVVFYGAKYTPELVMDNRGGEMAGPKIKDTDLSTSDQYFMNFACDLAAHKPITLKPVEEYSSAPMYWDIAREVQDELKREGVF